MSTVLDLSEEDYSSNVHISDHYNLVNNIILRSSDGETVYEYGKVTPVWFFSLTGKSADGQTRWLANRVGSVVYDYSLFDGIRTSNPSVKKKILTINAESQKNVYT